MPTIYNKLNNYDFSDEGITEIKLFLEKGELPERLTHNLNVSTVKNYERKVRGFQIVNNHLYYAPKHLTVIPESEKQAVLKKLYDDVEIGVGSGVTQFYFKVVSKYLNITRNDCADFLDRQKTFQITRPINHQINKPVLASRPNERWSIDLVDMNNYKARNSNNRYILTCIDYFSSYVWARPLKTKTAIAVRDALQSICHQAGTNPHIIMKDNGTEFQGETNEWMKANNIKWANTLSYTPQSNGKIENFNSQLRKMLREIFIRTNDTNWINFLQACLNNKNTQRNSTIKARPIDVWTERDGFKHNVVARRIMERAKKEVEKNKTLELNVGDWVRVKMSALYSQVRKMIKDNDKKYLVVKYTPEVYRIRSILKPDHAGYEKLRYTLTAPGGEQIDTQLKRNNPNKERRARRFFATDLLCVATKEESPQKPPTFDNDSLDIYDAHKLNKINQYNDESDYIVKRPVAKKKVIPLQPVVEPIVEVPTVRRSTREKRQVIPPPPTLVENKLIGRRVIKEFPPHGFFQGEVVSYKKPYYKVVYQDDDSEELTLNQLKKILIAEQVTIGGKKKKKKP